MAYKVKVSNLRSHGESTFRFRNYKLASGFVKDIESDAVKSGKLIEYSPPFVITINTPLETLERIEIIPL